MVVATTWPWRGRGIDSTPTSSYLGQATTIFPSLPASDVLETVRARPTPYNRPTTDLRRPPQSASMTEVVRPRVAFKGEWSEPARLLFQVRRQGKCGHAVAMWSCGIFTIGLARLCFT